LTELANVVAILPLENATLLKYLCEFLIVVATKSEQNKMGRKNLATVFGPNILKGNPIPSFFLARFSLPCNPLACLTQDRTVTQ